ncbi:Ig-like domain-containing protein [Bremerella cremea]|nr:peptidylprolyl isomerase [Bremerella cremea]
MTELSLSLPIVAAFVVLLCLVATTVWGMVIRSRTLKLAPALARKGRRSSQGQPVMQQLESREMMDASMGNQALALEGESLTVNGVTYENVDMIALAKAFAASGAKMYGADWCPHCTVMKEKFGEGKYYLPFVEVSNYKHQTNSIGVEKNITSYPTWVFHEGTANEVRLTGDSHTLEELINAAGISVPQSEPLYFAEIPDHLELKAGQSYHIALDGYSPTGQNLTYTVTTSNGTIETSVLQNNRSLRVSTVRFGDMEFHLFEDEVGNITSRIVELAESGAYDGMLFHRVINNFMIQTGQVTDNSSPSQLWDAFDPDLRHNQSGMLALAKTAFDDTGTSQFYITEGDQSYLDFNHPVFGFLTEGDGVRESISNTYTNGSVPIWDVIVDKVSVFTDTENGVLRIKLPEGISENETVTVTVSDGQGNTISRTFHVSSKADDTDYNPFFSYIPNITLQPGQSTSFQLNATSVDGDPIVYTALSSMPNNLSFVLNQQTGLVQINTSVGLAPGVYTMQLAVSDQGVVINSPTNAAGILSNRLVDYQALVITVGNPNTLVNDTVHLTEDAPVVFNPMANDSNSSGDFAYETFKIVTPPAVGQLSYNASSGEVTYTPPADFNGSVSFQYSIANKHGLVSAPATVTLLVAAINDPPEALDDIFHADRDSATLLPVLKNDDKGAENEANDPVIVVLPSGFTNAGGQVVVVGDQIQYTPPTGFTGTDTFNYTINDAGLESTATVSVDVRDVSQFTITVGKDATSVDDHGAVTNLPQSDQIIEEWDSFWIEVWVTASGTGGDAITAASATLNFDSSMYRANSIVIGPGFSAAGGNSTNNSNGTVKLNATSTIAGLGADQRVLLGRVRFTPFANGLAAPVIDVSQGLDFSQFLTSVSNASLTVNGIGTLDSPTTDATPSTRLLPMIYDLNDDGKVDLGDLSEFVAAYGNYNSTKFIDFDLTGDLKGSGFDYFQLALGANFLSQDKKYQISPLVLDAAISDAILTNHTATGSWAESLSRSDILGMTSLLPENIISPEVTSDTNAVSFQIVDLPGNQLAKTVGSMIYIDDNAAGWGWFVDSTPLDSSEYQATGNSGHQQAITNSMANGRIDLLSVLLHELGHVAGLEHTDEGIMSSTILPGQRLTDREIGAFDETFYVAAVDQFFSDDE